MPSDSSLLPRVSQAFEFLPEWGPVGSVGNDFGTAFLLQSFFQCVGIVGNRMREGRAGGSKSGGLDWKQNHQPTMQIGRLERGDGDHFGLKLVKRRLQAPQVFRLGEDDEIHVAAKFRSAVKHACLAAHQQAADAMTPHRRKDCLCRVRVQGSLLVR